MSKKSKEGKEEVSKEKEPYRNWFLLLGVISGVAIGLAAGSILVNRDSEKDYSETRREVLVRQDSMDGRLRAAEKRIEDIQKNNKEREEAKKEMQKEIEDLKKRIKEEREYIDEKRTRIWKEIDEINKTLEEQKEKLRNPEEKGQSKEGSD